MFAFPTNHIGIIDPRSLGNCEVWLRSDLGITTSGSALKTWANQGTDGTSADATATGTGCPTYASSGGVNGRAKITFNGTTNVMTWALSSAGATGARTWAIVWKMLSTPGTGFTIYYALPGNAVAEMIVDLATYKNVGWVDAYTTGLMAGYDFTLGTTLAHYHIHTYNGSGSTSASNYTATQDNTTKTVVDSGAYGAGFTPTIGARSSGVFYANIELYEVLSFSGQFNESQLNTLNTYLKSLYGL